MSSKIIKIYFYFLLVVFPFAGASYISPVKDVYKNSLSYLGHYLYEIKGLKDMKISMASVVDINTKNDTSYTKQGITDINFDDSIIFDAKTLQKSVKKDEKGVLAFELSIKTMNDITSLEKLRIQLNGIEKESIQLARLIFEDEEISSDDSSDNSLLFDLKGITLNKNSINNITLKIDFSESISVNQRFRFSIENPNDFVLSKNKSLFSIKSSYPIKSDYISVVGEKIQKKEL